MTTARWIVEFKRQIRRGKHILLHGNVQDLIVYRGAYVNLGDCLEALLEEEGYAWRVGYDQVDGVTFRKPETREAFFELIRPEIRGQEASAGSAYRLPGRSRPGSQPGAQPAPAAPRAATPSAGSSTTGAPGSSDQATAFPDLIAPDVAMPALRRALRSDRRTVSVVIDFTDKLTASQDHQDMNERMLMVQIRKATGEATRYLSGPMAGRRNVLVMVAGNLGQVPAWLYRDNPLVQVIQVDRPQAEERKHFLQQRYRYFFRAPATAGNAPDGAVKEEAGPPDDRKVEEFADLTEGLSNWDLEALRLTSFDVGYGLDRIRELVEFYKYGEREDHWENLNEAKVRQAEQILRQRIIGQDKAVEAVLNMLITAKVGVRAAAGGKSGRPKGVFFFVGPTGVGKTELAKSLTELIFGDERAFARFDMSEYSQEHAAEKLTGAPPSYVGYEAGGQLTNRMKTKPFSLLLFDEIEKAHPRLMDRFLQVLDDGRLTDGQGETVYFSQSVIIFTSNLGSTYRVKDGDVERAVAAIKPGMSYDQLEGHYRQAVKDHFQLALGRPEILNRLGENIVVFDMLRPEFIPPILDKFLQGLRRSAKEKSGIDLVFDDSLAGHVSAWCGQEDHILLGGRGIRNIVENQIEQALNRHIFYHAPSTGAKLRVSWQPEAGVRIEPI